MSNHPAAKSPWDTWLTVNLLAEAEDAFTPAAIRSHIFNATPRKTSKGIIPGNGLAPHIRRIGVKVLINHGGFLSWIDGSGQPARSATGEPVQNSNLPLGEYGKPVATAQGKAAQADTSPSKARSFATVSSKQGSRRRA